MRALLFLSFNFLFSYLNCSDFNSYEVNQLEITPIYDIILFNDIAEVIKDFDNDLNSQSDAQSFTESESNENIEELLMEYQHYLEKAHKQRIDYLEKVSGKNKVPLLRHERYSKKQLGLKNHIEDYYRPFSSNVGLPQKILTNIAPFISGLKSSKFPYTTSNILQYTNLPPALDTKKNHKILSSCYCKINEIPCNCGCKQCITAIDHIKSDLNYKVPEYSDGWNAYVDPFVKQVSNEKTDNDLKIRIKLDVKLPKILERLLNFFSNKDEGLSNTDTRLREEPSINYLSPFFKVPNQYKYTLNSIPRLPESIPLQRITIHKKKKFRNNINKKHKNKVVNFHGFAVDKNGTLVNRNITNEYYNKTLNPKNIIPKSNNITDTEPQISNSTIMKSIKVSNQSNEFIYLTLNISNDNENHTEEVGRLENSIETGYFKTKDNYTTILSNVREKRAITLNNNTFELLDLSVKPLDDNIHETHDKKVDKLLNDPSLLYWSENKTSNYSSKDINSLIFNIEKRKSKFNMSRENIRKNHSKAIEKAIFGEIDWNDIDTVAPVFMSFVGKYVHGVLTFCSDTICHSMKCADKICIHRNCVPANRYNNKGHCLGSNNTDSTAKMESIMDLPSNLAFEIVDILQDKMIGKMYGKMTICIGLKCITFVASKKAVHKSKCTSKEFTSSSECPFNKQNFKHVK